VRGRKGARGVAKRGVRLTLSSRLLAHRDFFQIGATERFQTGMYLYLLRLNPRCV
jgi:hypothetical protein